MTETSDPRFAKSLYERAITAGIGLPAINALALLVEEDDPEYAKSLYERAIAAGDEHYASLDLANLMKRHGLK